MSSLPEPLVPADCDMRGLQFMPLDVVRLMDSDIFALSTGDEFKAAVALWCKSWLQVPAGSIPNDDRVLAHLSGAGARWKKLRSVALRGFIECLDGRLYHPVVCEKAREAWEFRLRQRERSAKGNAKRWGQQETSFGDPHGDPHGDPMAIPMGNPAGSQGTGTENRDSGSSLRSDPAAVPAAPEQTGSPNALDEDPKAVLFSAGLKWLAKETDRSEKSLRPLLGKMLADIGGDAHAAALLGILRDAKREGKVDPIGWIQGMIAGRSPRAGPAPQRRNPDLEAAKALMREFDERDNSNRSNGDIARSALGIFGSEADVLSDEDRDDRGRVVDLCGLRANG